MKKCIICKKEYEGFGNNAQPVKYGRCCDNCNSTMVVPARLGSLLIQQDGDN